LKKYETTFIIDSLIKSEDIESIITKIEKFISNNGGQIVTMERWGKKRLAYEIKKRQYGYYVYIKYSAPNKLNRLLEREYQLDENILRYLTLMIDPRTEKVVPVRSVTSEDAVDNESEVLLPEDEDQFEFEEETAEDDSTETELESDESDEPLENKTTTMD